MNGNDLDLLKLLTTDGATLTLTEARQETGRSAPRRDDSATPFYPGNREPTPRNAVLVTAHSGS